MMMGAGLLFMLAIGLVVIGVPVLIAALIAGGGLKSLFKSQTGPLQSDHSPVLHSATVDHNCPSCGRGVKPDWNICPSCGAALT
ncbi:MAG: zinc ribbon domain-containing protein [Chloroflexi bacterium]|nr:zinc ribbon domain-containing protein [Chloroflexota bacterium]